jgi:S-adenosylmethionine decarboxylase
MYQDFDMGKHILLNLERCENVDSLTDLKKFELFIPGLLSECNATPINSIGHQFDGGFTYLSLLTTSHFSIHTWPELESAAIDLFTCSDAVNCEEIVKRLVEYFSSGNLLLLPVLR